MGRSPNLDWIIRLRNHELLIARNVYRFRRLKWGAPDEKLRVVPPEPTDRTKIRVPVDTLLVLATVASVAYTVFALL